MKKLFLLSFILLLSNAALCATWVGTTGNWSDPGNWDTGQVPAAGEAVYIPGGTVNVHKNVACRIVDLFSTAKLIIHQNASLAVSPNISGFGVNLAGLFENYGTLTVSNTSSTSPSALIRVSYKAYNYGVINLQGLATQGLRVSTTGLLANENEIIIEAADMNTGMSVWGELSNDGDLSIMDAIEYGLSNFGSLSNTGGRILINGAGFRGFSNEGNVSNNGNINIFQSAQFAFVNTIGATGLTNGGGILIGGYQETGIVLSGSVFKNYGSIEIYDDGDPNSKAILVNTDSYNYASGEITIYDLSGYGLYCSTLFKNYGTIDIDVGDGGTGLFNTGNFRNLGSAGLNINASGNSTAFRNTGGGLAVNQALVRITAENLNALHNAGTFRNRFGGTMTVDNDSGTGIYNIGTFLNRKATLVLDGVSATVVSIDNAGAFTNDRCGSLICRRSIENNLNASFTNNAFLFSSSPAQHLNNGSWGNNGIIHDPADTFSGTSINNNGIIIAPIVTLAYVGQPVQNALKLGSLANASVIGWYTDKSLSVSAGTYDANNNTFTPSAAAEGYDKLYVIINLDYDISCGGAGFEVHFDQPIQSLLSPPAPFSDTREDYELVVFPNPASSRIQLRGLPPHVRQVQLYNTQGQLVREYHLEDEPVQMLDIGGISSGAYWLRAGAEAKAVIIE